MLVHVLLQTDDMGREASRRWDGDVPPVMGGLSKVACGGRRGLSCVRRDVWVGGDEEEGVECVGCHHFH